MEINVYVSKHGYWVAECPLLPGYIAQGETQEEAVEKVQKAIQGYIVSMQAEVLPTNNDGSESAGPTTRDSTPHP